MDAVHYDPFSYELDADPYPVYRALRDRAPVYRNEAHDFWALTRFDDVLAAFLDWETWSSARGTVLELMDLPALPPIMIFTDPPRQTRLRNLVSKVFTPRRVSALEPEIRRIAAGYLDPLVGKERFDVVKEFTAKLPMDVISALLGIPPADRDAVRESSNDMMHRDPGSPFPPRRAIEANAKLVAYFTAALDERRRQPRDDLMSALLAAEIRGEDGRRTKLTGEEVVMFANLLASAGNETVTKFLASSLYWLWRCPDERRALRAEPGLIPNAVEETLRYDPPSQYQGRTTTREVSLHGRLIPKGAKVLLVNAATGRDERRFPDPERYDVRRTIDLHLGFGYGHHVCLGASFARLESRIALEEILRRFPEWDVAKDGIEWMHSSNVRGMSGLVLEIPGPRQV